MECITSKGLKGLLLRNDAEEKEIDVANQSAKNYGGFQWFVLITAISGYIPANAENSGKSIIDDQCLSCHTISPKTAKTLKQFWERKGPDLSSAGIKYKQDWLVSWLQKPVNIRPAGMFYGNHIKIGEKSDEIDTSSLVKHPQLSSKEAEQVAEQLIKLKHNQSLVIKGKYKPGSISITMGDMIFDKFKGCLACHQIEPGYGGTSGPEMYTAANRLQEDYLISFMRNPQSWEPKNIMPNKHLKEKDLQKLVHYLRALSQEKIK